MGPPTLDDLLDSTKCQGSTLVCIPYGQCCTMDEYCDLNKGECASCFPENLSTDAEIFDFCQTKAQFNISSYMTHPSCYGACDARFGRESFFPKVAKDVSDCSDWMIATIVVSVCLLVGALAVLILVKWIRGKGREKEIEPNNNNPPPGGQGLHNSQGDVAVNDHRRLRDRDIEQPTVIRTSEDMDRLAQEAALSNDSGDHESHQLLTDGEQVAPPDDSSQATGEAETSFAGRCSGPRSPSDDQARTRSIHNPEVDRLEPHTVCPSGSRHSRSLSNAHHSDLSLA